MVWYELIFWYIWYWTVWTFCSYMIWKDTRSDDMIWYAMLWDCMACCDSIGYDIYIYVSKIQYYPSKESMHALFVHTELLHWRGTMRPHKARKMKSPSSRWYTFSFGSIPFGKMPKLPKFFWHPQKTQFTRSEVRCFQLGSTVLSVLSFKQVLFGWNYTKANINIDNTKKHINRTKNISKDTNHIFQIYVWILNLA